MINADFTSDADGLRIVTSLWPTTVTPARGVVQIAHGLAEHAARYSRLADALNAAGYHVAATDHRGHGASIVDTPGDFGEAGFAGLWHDVAQFGRLLHEQYPGLPVYLLGHSMGSFATQCLLPEFSSQYAGVVLSGTTAIDVMAQAMADAPASDLSAFNAGFEPRTGYEWLSRDEHEVDLYVADPLCGFALPPQTTPSMFADGARLADPAELARIRSELPILVMSGSDDPLAGQGQLIQLVGQRYRDAGVSDVTVIVYPGARHEIFNETNRDEVTADLLAWLEAH